MPEIMIFKTGSYPQGDWPKERVRKMVDAYDPDKGIEASVVIGHRFYSENDEAQFAHGWVAALRMDGAGKVYADIPEFSAEARRAMAENKLRYVSAEIFEFDKLDERQPPYLRSVALLGRDTPTVATTRLPTLFGLINGGALSTLDEEKHIAAFTRRVSAAEISALSKAGTKHAQDSIEEDDMGGAEKLEAELAELKEQLVAFRRENTELKVAGRKSESAAYFERLRDEGKLAPALFDRVVALDVRLDADESKALRALFGDLPVVVDLSGTHAAGKPQAGAGRPASASLGATIRAYQGEKSLPTFAAAAEALFAESPDLFGEEDGGEEVSV